MDVSMELKVALGLLETNGAQLAAIERVKVVRELTKQTMIRHLRGFEPISDILNYRTLNYSKQRRIVPQSNIFKPSEDLQEESCLEIHAEFKWDDTRSPDRKRHDTILYLSKEGLILLWSGSCEQRQDGHWIADVYDSLSISNVDDDRLGEFLMVDSNFEALVEKLRILQKKSHDTAEAAIREMRDNLRRTTDIQRRLQFFPRERLRD